MIWTKSLELSLKLRYHLTQRTMISRSKCRPLNRSTAAGRLVIRRLWQATTFSAFCTRTPTTAVPAEIQEAQLQFENWRQERERGGRIPENLWARAVELAKQHGV